MLYNKMLITLLAAGCSCVWIAKDKEYAYCVSAAHCVKADTDVAHVNGKSVGVRWIQVDREADLAIGKAFAKEFPDLEPTIADAASGPAVVIGFPHRQPELRHADLEPETIEIDGQKKTEIVATPPIQPGTSGGAVMQDGALVGIVTHGSCRGGACTTTKDLYRNTKTAGITNEDATPTQRDVIVAAAAAAAAHYWTKKKGEERKWNQSA